MEFETQYYLYTGHEIEDTLDIDNRNSFTITTNKNLIQLTIRASKLEFLTKKLNYLHSLGKRLLRFLLTIFPAAEKTLSEGTEVEGAHKYFLAIQENCQRSVNVCGRVSNTNFSLGSTVR